MDGYYKIPFCLCLVCQLEGGGVTVIHMGLLQLPLYNFTEM